ncbi:MAG: biotin--[acetyl-CoA-carboxylase] ligase, partial [Duncaniella sp.]|nr:biotin--[acetyl-CoA-carboxylase] ligase [Duncaniella sp.]
VSARRQTAGRGQRGNSWESAPGKNITMSILLRPEGLHPSRQFVISRAVSLAITGVLRRYMPASAVRVKWPNDIYVDDRKICGILIENVISSASIRQSVVGIGINVNQRRFLSDAPNPVSMA